MATAASSPVPLPQPVALTRALDSPLSPLLVFSAECATTTTAGAAAAAGGRAAAPARAARETLTVYLVAEPLLPALAHTLRSQLCSLRHPSLLALTRVEAARSLGAISGFTAVARPEHRSWADRPATMLVAEDRSPFRSLAQFIQSRGTIPADAAASTPTVGLLLCMRALLQGVEALHGSGHAHGFISPSWIFISQSQSASSTPLLLAGAGVHSCLRMHNLQSMASASPYVRAEFRPADLHSTEKLMRADMYAAARCMLDLAVMKLSTAKLGDSGALLQEVQQVHGADVSALFRAALGDAALPQLLQQLFTSITTCLVSRGHIKAEGRGKPGSAMVAGPPSLVRASSSPSTPSSGAAAAAAAAAATGAASAASATGAAAFFPGAVAAVPPGALATGAPASFHRATSAQSDRDWRIVRAIYQGERTPSQPEISCHVNIKLADEAAFSLLEHEVQTSFAVVGQPPVCLCHESSFAPVDAATLMATLRAIPPGADMSLVLLVFDADAERRLYTSIQQDISFQPHHSMLTEDPGEYARASSEKKNALPIAWSLGEFIDNAISAQRFNSEKGLPRRVALQFLEYSGSAGNDWVLVIEDEGEGLNRDTLKDFATFGASRKVRQLERTGIDPEAPDYLSGQIGEFGVGSKQAAFFNGRALSVVTAQDNSRGDATSSVHELEIGADKMDAAYRHHGNPYLGVVNSRARGAIQHSYLNPALLRRARVRQMIEQGETGKRQFTRIIISQVQKSHHKKLAKRDMIVHELVRLYQYYIYGIAGIQARDDQVADGDAAAAAAGASSSSSVPASATGLQISLAWYRNDAHVWSTDDLSRVVYDPTCAISPSLQFMLLKRGTPFHFTGCLRGDDPSQFTIFSGTINYYPFTEGEESHPEWAELKDIEVQANRRTGASAAAAIDIDADEQQPASKKRKGAAAAASSGAAAAAAAAAAVAVGKVPADVFECTWNGRVIPSSSVNSLKWIDAACRGKMAQCRFRLKGVLHFVDSVFLRPSKNKLTLSHNDLSRFIDTASYYLPSSGEDGRKVNRRSGTVDLYPSFSAWLKTQHERLDREIEVDESTATKKDDRVHYTRFSFRLGDELVTLDAAQNHIISLSKSKEFGRLLSYSLKDTNSSAGALVHYARLPREVHHEQPTHKSVQHLDLLAQPTIAQLYKTYRQTALKFLPEKLDVKYKITDAAQKKLTVEKQGADGSLPVYPAGVRFSEQEVNALGHPDERGHRDLLRGGSLRILRGVFRHIGEGGARHKRKAGGGGGDLAEHLPYHDFFRPVAPSYLTQGLTDRTVFREFDITKAGEYLVEYSIAEMNWIKLHAKFNVAPGPPASLLLIKPPRPPTLALGQSWLTRAVSVKFEDQFQNECECAEMMQRYSWQLAVGGKVNAVAKHLEFACRLSSSGGAAGAAAGAAAAPAASDKKTIWLDLQVLVAEGQRVTLHGPEEVLLRLQLHPRVNIKRAGGSSSSQVAFEATFEVAVVAGAPASLLWAHLPNDEADAAGADDTDDDEAAVVQVINGLAASDLQVQVCDMAGNAVSFSDGAQRKLLLSIDLPSPLPAWLTGTLVEQSQTASVERDGIARFRGVMLGVQSAHFRSVNITHVDVPVRAHLPGSNLRSPQLIVRVQASRTPREIRVQPERVLVDDLRAPRHKTRRSAGAAAAAAPTSATNPADPAAAGADGGPVTLLGSVGSELPLRFSLYDEAGREVSISDLQKELGHAQAAQVTATVVEEEEGDAEMDAEVMAAAALVLAPQDDDVDMATADGGIGSSATPRRKRKLSARALAAAEASSPKRRMRTVALLDGGACELQVKGLRGVTHFLLSSLPGDGSLSGVTVPSRVAVDIEASLLLTLPHGALHCDFIVRPVYDAPVSLECRVLATASIDHSLADAVQLIYFDRHGNVVPAPVAELQVDIEPVGGAIPSVAAAEGDDAEPGRRKHSFTVAPAVATSPKPLAGVNLHGATIGTYVVSVAVPSLPHLAATAHVLLTVGAVTQLRFTTTADTANAVSNLTLQVTTRSFLPAFRILACDAGGNVCTGAEGEVTLKSALLPQFRKLQLRNGECGVPANSTIVRYSTPNRMVPISVHMTVGAGAGAASSTGAAARSQKKGGAGAAGSDSHTAPIKLNQVVAVSIGPTRRFLHEFGPLPEEIASLSLCAGSSWPAIRVRVTYEAEGDALEPADVANFTLTVEKRSNGRGAGAGAAAAATRYQYPARRIDADGLLVFEAPADEVVRSAGEHKFTLRFEEHDAALLAVLPPSDIHRERMWVAQSTPGAPASIERGAAMSPPERPRVGLAGGAATRHIATAVTFTFLDKFANPLSETHLQHLMPNWTELCSCLLMEVVRTDVPASSSSSPTALPTLLPVDIVSHADHVEIPSLRVSVGSDVPMGSYAITFSFPHLASVAIDPLPFDITDNTELALVRAQVMERMDKQRRKLAGSIKARTEAAAMLKEQQDRISTLHARLAHCGDGLPAHASADQVQAALEAERALVAATTLAAEVPQRFRLSEEVRAQLRASPDWIGPLYELAAPLRDEDDCRIISWSLASRIRGHLLRRTGPIHMLLRSHNLPCLKLDQCPQSAPPQPPPAGTPGNPRLVSELLCAHVKNPDFVTCVRFICRGLLVMDNMASAQEYCKTLAQRGVASPVILCLAEMESISGGWDDSSRRAPPLATLRANAGSFAVRPSQARAQALQHHQHLLHELADAQHRLTAATNAVTQAESLEAQAASANRQLVSLQNEMDRTKTVPPQLPALLAALAEDNRTTAAASALDQAAAASAPAEQAASAAPQPAPPRPAHRFAAPPRRSQPPSYTQAAGAAAATNNHAPANNRNSR